MNDIAVINLNHLDRLSDHRGVFARADGAARREADGYCTDDNARLLVVTTAEPDADVARRLNRVALRFVLDAQDKDGQCRNRRDRLTGWADDTGEGDSWGRVVWALGMASTHHADALIRRLARNGYDKSVMRRPSAPRAVAFAALGAVAVASIEPNHKPSLDLLAHAISVIGELPEGEWRWPRQQLEPGDAVLAEALIAAGDALNRMDAIDRGLTMLGWLLARETATGHLSSTPLGGRNADDAVGGFDQSPVAAAALADACWRAYTVTSDKKWLAGVSAAADWFAGVNDGSRSMLDPSSGGAYQSLGADGANLDEGAEAALAYITTMQRVRALESATR